MAAEVVKEREQIDYLRAKIRAAANASLIDNPNDAMALSVFRALRRKLSLEDCEKLLSSLPINEVDAESPDEQNANLATKLSASDGQNVRHHHKSNKEHIDKENVSYEAAQERLGALRAAATVWAIMQFHDKIKAVGAYFRSITTGSKSKDFSPERLIRRLASAPKCAD